jgi:hypothetical protein
MATFYWDTSASLKLKAKVCSSRLKKRSRLAEPALVFSLEINCKANR